jgi:hypothetical protein
VLNVLPYRESVFIKDSLLYEDRHCLGIFNCGLQLGLSLDIRLAFLTLAIFLCKLEILWIILGFLLLHLSIGFRKTA